MGFDATASKGYLSKIATVRQQPGHDLLRVSLTWPGTPSYPSRMKRNMTRQRFCGQTVARSDSQNSQAAHMTCSIYFPPDPPTPNHSTPILFRRSAANLPLLVAAKTSLHMLLR